MITLISKDIFEQYPINDLSQQLAQRHQKQLWESLQQARRDMLLYEAVNDEQEFETAKERYIFAYKELENKGFRKSTEAYKKLQKQVQQQKNTLQNLQYDLDGLNRWFEIRRRSYEQRKAELEGEIAETEARLKPLQEQLNSLPVPETLKRPTIKANSDINGMKSINEVLENFNPIEALKKNENNNQDEGGCIHVEIID